MIFALNGVVMAANRVVFASSFLIYWMLLGCIGRDWDFRVKKSILVWLRA